MTEEEIKELLKLINLAYINTTSPRNKTNYEDIYNVILEDKSLKQN